MQDSNAHPRRLIVAAAAAFCTYFCMYAFRRPFTAGTFEGRELFGVGLKSVLVISQLMGYMFSKFIGIKVVSEMQRRYRAAAIIGMILFAEIALVGFGVVPLMLKPGMMFLERLAVRNDFWIGARVPRRKTTNGSTFRRAVCEFHRLVGRREVRGAMVDSRGRGQRVLDAHADRSDFFCTTFDFGLATSYDATPG